MSKVKIILSYIVASLAVLVGLVFAFVELRSLFAGDFTLMNVPAVSFFGYLFRGLYYLLMLTLGVFIILFLANKKDFCIVLFSFAVALFIGAFITLAFYEYFVSLVLIAVTTLLVGITAMGFFKKNEGGEAPIVKDLNENDKKNTVKNNMD